jgi:transcriptional regulator with PAS, ATPase and Fis domain
MWAGSQIVSVDLRVIAANNRDLPSALAEGTFRQDLFYRLNVFPIRLPALRERISDISLLVGYLIDRYTQRACPGLDSFHSVDAVNSHMPMCPR